MDSTFQGVYENKAKQIFHVAFKRLPTETELERMVKMLKKGGGFYVGQAVDKELLDKQEGECNITVKTDDTPSPPQES